MRLKSISLHGFKSFNTRTEIPLSEGITAIEGPNGCGKSNISDSIRWVLGEGNVRNLRGESILDVIFKGAGSVKPSGFAEVSLLIDNEDQALSLDQAEVAIARRVYRSGDSDFLINNLPCRLKDIRNLFLGTGLGSHGYSVIEREMVDAVLSDRDDRRRLFFEEAAGISRYKIQRGEAMRKLDATEQDLVRIDDLVREIEREVRRLARQVGKARKHQRLHDQIRDLEVRLALKQWIDLETRRLACASERDAGAGVRERLTGELVRMEAEQETRKLRLMERERLLEETRSLRENLLKEQSSAREQGSVLATQIDGWKRREEELATRITTESERAEALRRRIKERRPEHARIVEELQQQRSLVAAAQSGFAGAEKHLRSAREEVARTAQVQMKHLLVRTEEGKELEALSERMVQLEKRSGETTAHRERVLTTVRELAARLESLEEELRALEEQRAGVDKDLRQTRQSSEIAQKQREELREQREDLARRRASLESRLNLLREQKARHEGFDVGVRMLINRRDRLAGMLGVVGELISTADDLPAAMAEALLADAVQWVVVVDEAAAFAALDLLRSEGLGGVTFFPLFENSERFAGYPPHWGESPPIAGPPDLYPLVHFLLSRVCPATSRQSALFEARAGTLPALRYLSPEGEIFASEGWLRAPGGQGRDHEIVERIQEIPRLEASCRRLGEEEESTARRLSESEATITGLQGTVRSLEQQREDLSDRRRVMERRQSESQVERGLLLEEGERVAAEQRTLEGQLSQLQQESVELERRLGVTGETEREAERLHRDAKVTEAGRERERDEALEQLSGCRTEAVRLENALQQLDAAEERDSEEVTRLETALDQWAEERSEAGRLGKVATSERADLQGHLAGMVGQLDELERDLDSRRRERDEEQTELAVHDQEVRRLRSELNGLQDRLHDDQVREVEIRSEMERLRAQILQEFRVDLAEEARGTEGERADADREKDSSSEEEPEDEEQQRLQIADLRQKLLQLGPVNFLAADEYAQQKERLLFHRKQQEDLRKARQDLLDAIQQINETAGRMFKETFELARVHFQETFESLFPGGEADLIFHGEDPLEGSIEIKARPRGKRLEVIRLLSTGERSLTAISLLFGIYLVKPSPFCILDELDAPLDDANIDRFITLLRHFSQKTQFVVITHNKRTMEAADRLFGVTMQSAGISKIVSVRLSDADWELSPAAAEVLQTSGEEGGET